MGTKTSKKCLCINQVENANSEITVLTKETLCMIIGGVETSTYTAICRCGSSTSLPYCSGAHEQGDIKE